MYASGLRKQIEALFTDGGFLFEEAEQGGGMLLRSAFLLGEDAALPSITLLISLQEREITVRAFAALPLPAETLPKVGEYLHRVNFGMKTGCFELDYDGGTAYYKIFLDGTNRKIADAELQNAVLLCGRMWRQYGGGLLKLAQGNGDPALLQRQAENNA